MKQVKARVISNSAITGFPGTAYFLLRVSAPEVAAVSRPGQFCMLDCGPGVLLRRPLSIHGVSPQGVVFFLYAARDTDATSGRGTKWLSGVAPGSEIDIIGPLGNGFATGQGTGRVLLVAGGIGIAPLAFLAGRAASLGIGVTLLAGARCREGLLPVSLLPAGIDIIQVVEPPESGPGYLQGKVTDFIDSHLERADRVFACGPAGMLEAIGNYVDNRAVTKPVQVSLEVRMGCGLGTCYGCSIRTRQGMQRVCKEGPVFNIKDIIWQEVKI